MYIFTVCYKHNHIDKAVLGPARIDMALRSVDEYMDLNYSGVNDSHAKLIADKLISSKSIKRVFLSSITQKH